MDLSATPIHPHRFIGYWGYGWQPELNQCLSTILAQANASQHCVRSSNQAEKMPCHGTAVSPNWGVGYLGLAEVPPLQIPGQTGKVIVALSASGLAHCPHEHGMYPDAWIYLNSSNHLVLGREPFGRVPLYWIQTGAVLWFASHLQLLRSLNETPQINLAALYGYSCFSYVPTPLTPIAGVSAIPAGVEQVWQGDNQTGTLSQLVSHRSYVWQAIHDPIRDEPTAIAQLQVLLKQAVQRQVADLTQEPVGVFLSGGLDSAIVAALLVQAGLSVRAYTLDFGSAGTSEYPYAEQVAQFLQIPLTRVLVSPQQIRKALIPTVQALDLPFGDGVTVPLFLLAQIASQDTHIVFNGEGGDQLFAGWTNKPLIASGLYNGVITHPESSGEDPFVQQYLQTFHRLYGYESNVFQPDVLSQLASSPASDWIAEALEPVENEGLLHHLRRANLMLKGAQNIQPRATNLTSAHGLRVRSPFCDLPLAQWTFQVAGELLLQGTCEKYILKRAVENWLPPEVVWRSKRGMGVPLTTWCLNGLWSELGTWLNPARLQQEGVWQPDLATQIVMGQLGRIQGRRIGESLWLLLMWQVWRSEIAGVATQEYSWNHPFWCPPCLAHPYLRWRERVKQ